MGTEGLVPSYLAEIFNRSIPDPVDDNSPFFGFTAPVDSIAVLDDSVTCSNSGPGPFLYGVAQYARATYGNHP